MLFDDCQYESPIAAANDTIDRINKEKSKNAVLSEAKNMNDLQELDRLIKGLGKNTGRGN